MKDPEKNHRQSVTLHATGTVGPNTIATGVYVNENKIWRTAVSGVAAAWTAGSVWYQHRAKQEPAPR